MATTIQALPADGHGRTGEEVLGWTEDMGGQCYTQSGVSTLVTTTPCPGDLLRAQAPSPASHGEPQQHLDPGGDAAHSRHGEGPCVGGGRPWGWRGGGGRQGQERGGGHSNSVSVQFIPQGCGWPGRTHSSLSAGILCRHSRGGTRAETLRLFSKAANVTLNT